MNPCENAHCQIDPCENGPWKMDPCKIAPWKMDSCEIAHAKGIFARCPCAFSDSYRSTLMVVLRFMIVTDS